MEKRYVYELINLMGTVEYVGNSYRPTYRLYQHTKVKPVDGITGMGKFYGRADLVMNLVKEFDTEREANLFEGELKLSYGMNWDERERSVKGGRTTGLRYGRINGIKHNSKPVMVYKTDGTYVGEYYSAIEASRVLDLHQASVNRVVNNQQKQTQGYIIKKK